MKMKLISSALIGGIALSGIAFAEDASSLARNKGCMACHGVDKKIVGPAFKDVAAKYKGDSKASATLIEKVKMGGKGNWGQIPMPPNSSVSDAELKSLVNWVLTQ